jgi:hypothetical protein
MGKGERRREAKSSGTYSLKVRKIERNGVGYYSSIEPIIWDRAEYAMTTMRDRRQRRETRPN